jgi:sec-independent protein translocase protein TatC
MSVNRSAYPDDIFDRTRMTFADHLDELAVRMRRALAGVVLVLGAGVAVDLVGMSLKLPWLGFGFPALRFLTRPAEQQVDEFFRRRYEAAGLTPDGRGRLSLGFPDGPPSGAGDRVTADVDAVELARLAKLGELRAGLRRPITTLSAQEAMVTYFKVAFVLALLVASPWVYYQLWAFVAAGLYPHERRTVYLYLSGSLGLFLLGVAVCQFLVMPAAVRGLLEFNEWTGFDPDLRLREWVGFAVLLPMVFGVSFQTPLVMVFFTRIGVTSARGYLRYWRHAVMGLAVFAAVITPTQDMMTWAYLFVPMFGLYLVGVGAAALVEPRPEPDPSVPACDV